MHELLLNCVANFVTGRNQLNDIDERGDLKQESKSEVHAQLIEFSFVLKTIRNGNTLCNNDFDIGS